MLVAFTFLIVNMCVHLVAFFYILICTVKFAHFLTLLLKSYLFMNVFIFEQMYVAVYVCVFARALNEEAQGRESTINWATWISHAQLMRLKCVEQRRREGIADHTQTQDSTHTLVLTIVG